MNRAWPQVSSTFEWSETISTGLLGSDRAISERRRPETRTVPSSETVAGSLTFAEVVESKLLSVSPSPSASSSMPARIGAVGRLGRLRATQATASANASRSTRIFTKLPFDFVVQKARRQHHSWAVAPIACLGDRIYLNHNIWGSGERAERLSTPFS